MLPAPRNFSLPEVLAVDLRKGSGGSKIPAVYGERILEIRYAGNNRTNYHNYMESSNRASGSHNSGQNGTETTVDNPVDSRHSTVEPHFIRSNLLDLHIIRDEAASIPEIQFNESSILPSHASDEANNAVQQSDFPEELHSVGALVHCPLCNIVLDDMNHQLRHSHVNDCLEKNNSPDGAPLVKEAGTSLSQQASSGISHHLSSEVSGPSPVSEWLCSIGLEKYADIFIQQEIGMETLKWLTEEDLLDIGINALGPRKKIAHALDELRQHRSRATEMPTKARKTRGEEISKTASNKFITDYFSSSFTNKNKQGYQAQQCVEKSQTISTSRSDKCNNYRKLRNIPSWCCIPGTSFRVDSFRYLRTDCSHWFLTHFHMDHYQGLTKSFCHGKIYCSLITARLVNMKIGIPWDRLEVLPLNKTICIAGTDVTCFDANHCPGSIIIHFYPPNKQAVLHTGDFRFTEGLTGSFALLNPIHTLILDTTYCDPQYDFPKQEAVIQFVIEAIQAEAFNPRALFLIGSYTIGKERLFLEVARALQKKVYVTTAKMQILKCLELSSEYMHWLTLNECESRIHVVPMWTLASFKRLKHASAQYSGRFDPIVSFSPTGWTFCKGRKKSAGRRLQHGSIIRYEVPYSEHCSFTELKEFVKFISPECIIPSVNNDGPKSVSSMLSLLS